MNITFLHSQVVAGCHSLVPLPICRCVSLHWLTLQEGVYPSPHTHHSNNNKDRNIFSSPLEHKSFPRPFPSSLPFIATPELVGDQEQQQPRHKKWFLSSSPVPPGTRKATPLAVPFAPTTTPVRVSALLVAPIDGGTKVADDSYVVCTAGHTRIKGEPMYSCVLVCVPVGKQWSSVCVGVNGGLV